MKYDFAVFIGRFQPFHEGHLKVVLSALEQANKLIFVIGSAEGRRSTRNPLNISERIRIIKASLSLEQRNRVIFKSVPDHPYNLDRWIAAVHGVVFSAAHEQWRSGPTKIALAGMHKDATSFYLNLFPTWDSIAVQPHQVDRVCNSTDIRIDLYEKIDQYLDSNTLYIDTLVEIMRENSDEWRKLAAEFKYEQNYIKQWGKGPHTTVDSIVVQSGHILLIQRGEDRYGGGLWALPGGFVEPNETLAEAAIRELREETKLKVPTPVLRGSLVANKVYDEPYRDLRGRNISHAYHFRLSDVGELPKVKGSDDAQDARWFSINQLWEMSDQMFADHYSIIEDMLKL